MEYLLGVCMDRFIGAMTVDQHSHCLSGAPTTVTGHTSRVSWGICIVRTRGGIVRLYGAYVLVSM